MINMKICRKCINKAKGYEVFRESEIVATKCPKKNWEYINKWDKVPSNCEYKLEQLMTDE